MVPRSGRIQVPTARPAYLRLRRSAHAPSTSNGLRRGRDSFRHSSFLPGTTFLGQAGGSLPKRCVRSPAKEDVLTALAVAVWPRGEVGRCHFPPTAALDAGPPGRRSTACSVFKSRPDPSDVGREPIEGPCLRQAGETDPWFQREPRAPRPRITAIVNLTRPRANREENRGTEPKRKKKTPFPLYGGNISTLPGLPTGKRLRCGLVQFGVPRAPSATPTPTPPAWGDAPGVKNEEKKKRERWAGRRRNVVTQKTECIVESRPNGRPRSDNPASALFPPHLTNPALEQARRHRVPFTRVGVPLTAGRL